MEKSSIVRKHRGGVSTSKVLQGFKPISHCGVPVILKALARRISCNRRSFACAQDDALLQRGISPTRHCETRSVEAIHKSSLKRVQTDTSKHKGNGIPWIASLPLAIVHVK